LEARNKKKNNYKAVGPRKGGKERKRKEKKKIAEYMKSQREGEKQK